MEKLKVLIVDDSIVYRKILSMAVESTGVAFVGDTALNAMYAIEKMELGKYHVVLLDVNMPGMDGIETLKIIKERWPSTPVIMISGGGGRNAEITLKALETGAMDFVMKPLDEGYDKNMEIIRKELKVLFAQIQVNASDSPGRFGRPVKVEKYQEEVKKASITKISGVDMVLVASSTGGPMTLERIFNGFGRDFHKPLLIVQHMPPDFTKILAESLDKKSHMHFIEGSEGSIIRAGQGIVAPGGMHMLVKKGERSTRQIQLSKSEYVNGVRPAADVLFKSVADEYQGARILAVILTGMGSDGLEGVRELKKKCSCYCITQSEPTCVVYGMPRSIVEAGLSDEIADIGGIAARIQHIAEYGS